MKNAGWVIVVFEDMKEVGYVRGPFETYEAAEDWANRADDCLDWDITFLVSKDE